MPAYQTLASMEELVEMRTEQLLANAKVSGQNPYVKVSDLELLHMLFLLLTIGSNQVKICPTGF